ncbi:hypothetical protein A0H81_09040 [Grifola frondosa]|uniref:Uncharacterized protein n=1 Tax=Grifola frondosa TaxID=5627 RepID=A0A1C7M2J6_GRIFR|nr:hypothetical protein A0H81_09040 [Grifola frondosa]
MHLNCVFGSTPSTSTQRWSDNTLVCLLPPSTSSGVVQVWFDGMPKEEDGSPPSLFTYTDETDRALMELALQVVGLKMTGKIEDARNIAMRIVSTSSPNDTDPGMETSGAMQFASQANPSFDIRHLLLSRARDTEDFERLVLNFLSVLDVAVDTRVPSSLSSISHHTAGGQTLLHLAVLARFPALAKFLIMRGIDIDARDKNGCTALYFAATVGAVECAKLLVEAGAALDIVDGLGKTPVEVAPPGFFEFIDSDGGASEHSSDREGEHEDEAAWGDVDDDTDDDADVMDKLKRRGERKPTHWKLKTSHSVPEAGSPAEPKSTDIPMESKKALEAGLVDEKQAVASFTETLYRTLAQLQHPQGMIANIPNLPMLQKRHLPGMPAWGALPQMPAVFPVIVPIPHLFTLFGERRAQDRQSVGDDKQDGTAQPWLGIGASDWRAVWEKWIAQVNTSMRANEATDNPPPAYTPRNADEAGDSPLVDVKEEIPLAAEPSTHVGVDRAIARPVVYEAQPIPEDEVNSYEYRPARKLARKTQKKHDRMLVLFWIPILFIGIAWAFLHAIRIAFHATKTVVTLKAGLRV